MLPDARRLRLPWLTLACATLAACGGGGGGATPSTPPPPPPASESAYLLAEFVAADVNDQYVRVWDPANPAVAAHLRPQALRASWHSCLLPIGFCTCRSKPTLELITRSAGVLRAVSATSSTSRSSSEWRMQLAVS